MIQPISYINPLDPLNTGFFTNDYWGPWSHDFQATHLARMTVIAWLVFVMSGTTLRPYLGKLWAAMFVLGGAILWHAFQEVSYYAFAHGSSLAPPWIGNYAPQSMAYEVLLDLLAVVWALSTSCLLDTPCNFMFECVHKEGQKTKYGSQGEMTEAEARKERHLLEDEMRADEGRKKKMKLPTTGLMRSGGAAFVATFAIPLMILIVVPLSQIGITYWVSGVSTGFRVDVLIWCILWMVASIAYWLFVYFYLWKFGFGPSLEGVLADYFRLNVVYTYVSFALMLAFCFAFCCHSFMGGLEFIQPIYGFGAAFVPPIIFAIIIRWTMDKGLGHGKKASLLLKILRKETDDVTK